MWWVWMILKKAQFGIHGSGFIPMPKTLNWHLISNTFGFWIPIWASKCSIDERMWHSLHTLSFSFVRSTDSKHTIWYRENNHACIPFLGAATLEIIPICSILSKYFWQQGYYHLPWYRQNKRFWISKEYLASD